MTSMQTMHCVLWTIIKQQICVEKLAKKFCDLASVEVDSVNNFKITYTTS